MRAVCDGCGHAQPPDWKAGDLCSFCGKAVRRDVRCFWCVKWVPAAKFCRSCGAVIVEERLFGAARMLKDAGTDRFTIPKQLVEFDADQIENFSRIYQRHAIAVARHVDEVRFLEGFLRGKSWSTALEDQLIPQLPWPEAVLARMTAAPLPPGDDLRVVMGIEVATPFADTRALAWLARLRLGDWKAHDQVAGVFRGGDPAMRAEAALILSGWRVRERFGHARDLARELIAELQARVAGSATDPASDPETKLAASVGLALLGLVDQDLVRAALASTNRELAFGAALALGDLDRLRAGLAGDDLERIAAGNALIELGVIAPVAEPIRSSPLEVQRELVETLVRRKESAPELGETLLGIVESTTDDTLRERAARILCRGLRPEWAPRIARAARSSGNERSILQSMLSEQAALPADALIDIVAHMVENGLFTTNQYGLMETASRGAIPDGFVPARFAGADPPTRAALLRYAEKQLEARGDEALHRFVMSVVFGPFTAETRAAAWWVLHRWYQHQGDRRGEGPFRFTVACVCRFFGSVADFLPRLAALIGDHATMKEVGIFEFMATFLGSVDDEAIVAIQAEERGADELVAVLLAAAAGDYWPYTIESMITLVSRIGAHPRWRERVIAGLEAIGKHGNHHYDLALRRLRLSIHGIPEESRWDALPGDFVASRFASVDDVGRGELLKLAEHQLIHAPGGVPDQGLLRFLLATALRPGDPGIRLEALHIHQERAPRGSGQFALDPRAVEHAFGGFAGFVALLPAVLDDASMLSDRVAARFLNELLADPTPANAKSLTKALEQIGDPGIALVRGAISLVASKRSVHDDDRLRRAALRWLAKMGAHPTWRDEVVAALADILADPTFDLSVEGGYALRDIRATIPVPPPSPPPRSGTGIGTGASGTSDAPATPGTSDGYAEKYQVAQRLGRELQEAMALLMAGPASVEEKMREGTRLSEEFQARVKELYGA